jgi:mRNA-degrading endonuclease toxin of MazEF toxin-antitoxin module
MTTPDRGDVLEIQLSGENESVDSAMVLVLSPAGFNCFESALVCPVIAGGRTERSHGFAIQFQEIGELSAGLVLCHRLRTLRFRRYNARHLGRLPEEIIDDVLARIHTFI